MSSAFEALGARVQRKSWKEGREEGTILEEVARYSGLNPEKVRALAAQEQAWT